MTRTHAGDDGETLLRELDSDDCPQCTAGDLSREPFTGDDAVVCADCTSALRLT